MARYTVISLSVSGIGRRIHYHGEEVSEANFPQGNTPKLVNDGFIKLIEGTEDEAVGPTSPLQQEETEVILHTNTGAEAPPPVADEKKAYEDITGTQLKVWLTEKGIPFDENAKKNILYELYNPGTE